MNRKETLTRLLPWLYFALFLAVVATHVWLCWRVGEAHPIPKYDEAVYSDLAREMVRTGAPMRRLGEEPRFYYIHPYLQTFFWSIPLHGSVPEDGLQNPSQAIANLSKLRWVTTLFSVGTLCLIFGMFVRSAPGFGLLAATLLAFNPMWLKYSHLVYLEVPCAFWVMAAALSEGGILRNHFKELQSAEPNILPDPPMFSLFAGIALGVATITKYLSVLFAIPITFTLLFTPKKKLLVFWFGFLLSVLTWPLYILLTGDISEWLSRSFGRWSSFQGGQGGDPRTDWGIAELIVQVLKEFGPIYSVFFLLGVAATGITMLWWMSFALRCLRESGFDIRKMFEKMEKSKVWQTLAASRFASWTLFYVLICLILPTKDPKYFVIVLPLAMISATSVLYLIVSDLFDRGILGGWRPPLLIVAAVIFFLLAFPIDLLGVDNTRFKKLYPTDHAYTRVALPHGEDYLPISEDLFFRTKPGEVIPVGRQGPIIGYLADRPYQILYTEGDAGAFEKRFQTSRYLVIDDTWDHCFGGLNPVEVDALRLKVSKDYEVIQEVGHVKLLAKQ